MTPAICSHGECATQDQVILAGLRLWSPLVSTQMVQLSPSATFVSDDSFAAGRVQARRNDQRQTSTSSNFLEPKSGGFNRLHETPC